MYVIILVLVTVSARDISQADYNYEPAHHERIDRQFVNPQLESNQRHDNDNYRSPNDRVNLNNREQFSESDNREMYANDRGRNIAYLNQGRSHDNTGSMNVNLAFDRQDNQNGHNHNHGNFNIHRQDFNNNEHRNRDDSNQNRNHKYNDEILQARRQDDMIFEYNNNKKKQKETNQENNSPVENNVDIVTFLNNVNNKTNQHDLNRNNHRGNQGAFTSIKTKNYEPKTTIENEVAPDPTRSGEETEDRNLGTDKWVWGVEDTTTTGPNVTLDDRAAFTGDKCATGMVRVMGRCVEED